MEKEFVVKISEKVDANLSKKLVAIENDAKSGARAIDMLKRSLKDLKDFGNGSLISGLSGKDILKAPLNAKKLERDLVIANDKIALSNDKVSLSNNRVRLSNDRVALSNHKVIGSSHNLAVSENKAIASKSLLNIANNKVALSNNKVAISNNKVKASNSLIPLANDKVKISNDRVLQSNTRTQLSYVKLSQSKIKLKRDIIGVSNARLNALNIVKRGTVIQQRYTTEIQRSIKAQHNAAIAAIRLKSAQLKLTQQQAAPQKNGFMGSFAGGMAKRFAVLGGAYLGISAIQRSISGIVGLSDAYKVLQNSLVAVTNTEAERLLLSKELEGVSIRTRSDLLENAGAFARIDLAMQQLGGSQRQSLIITENINKAMLLGGASAMEQTQGLRQLSQALTKGKLDGDEFRTLMETMPLVVGKLTTALNTDKEGLLKLAPQGKITAKILSDAILSMSGDLDRLMESVSVTLPQGINIFKTMLVTTFGEIEKRNGLLVVLGESLRDVGVFFKSNKVELFELMGVLKSGTIVLSRFLNNVLLTKSSLNLFIGALKILGYTASATLEILKNLVSTVARMAGAMASGVTTLLGMKNHLWDYGQALADTENYVLSFNDAINKVDKDLSAFRIDTENLKVAETRLASITKAINSFEKAAKLGYASKWSKETKARFESLKRERVKVQAEYRRLLTGDANVQLRSEGLMKAIQEETNKKNDSLNKLLLKRADILDSITEKLKIQSRYFGQVKPEREINMQVDLYKEKLLSKGRKGGLDVPSLSQKELSRIDDLRRELETLSAIEFKQEALDRLYTKEVESKKTGFGVMLASYRLHQMNLISTERLKELLREVFDTENARLDKTYEMRKSIEDEIKLLGTHRDKLEITKLEMQLRKEFKVMNGDEKAHLESLLKLRNDLRAQSELENSILGERIRKTEKLNALAASKFTRGQSSKEIVRMGGISPRGTSLDKQAITQEYSDAIDYIQSLTDSKLISFSDRAKLVDNEFSKLKDNLLDSTIDGAINNLQRPIDNLTFETFKSKGESAMLYIGDSFTSGFKTLSMELANVSSDFFNTFYNGISDAIGEAIVEGTSFKDLLYNISKGALKELISGMVKMGLQWLIFDRLKKVAALESTAATVAQATAISAAWAPAAAAASLATLGANAPAAATALVSAHALSTVLSLPGKYQGGYTGDIGINQVAGFHHGQEYVVNHEATKRHRSTLEKMNRGENIDSNKVSVTIENYGSDKQFQVEQISPSDVRVIARDVAREEIVRNVPSLVAKNISNANSPISRSIASNTKAQRRFS